MFVLVPSKDSLGLRVNALYLIAVLIGGVGYHIEDIKNRFGVESGAEIFLQVCFSAPRRFAVDGIY